MSLYIIYTIEIMEKWRLGGLICKNAAEAMIKNANFYNYAMWSVVFLPPHL